MTTNKDAVYKDADGNRKTPADVGATGISAERAAELGWTEVEEDYQRKPTRDEAKRVELAAALADYNSALNVAIERINRADLEVSTKDAKIAAARTLAADAKTAYTAARNEIIAKYATV